MSINVLTAMFQGLKRRIDEIKASDNIDIDKLQNLLIQKKKVIKVLHEKIKLLGAK